MTDSTLKKNLIIVDGPSENGKSSLCKHLIDKYKFHYYHTFLYNTPRYDYYNYIIDASIKELCRYKSNIVIERMHISDLAISKLTGEPTEFDCLNFDGDLIEQSNLNGINYSLVMSLANFPEGQSESEIKLYNANKEVYEEYKDSMNIYRYNFDVDPDYTEFDNYLESKQQ